MFPFSKLFVPLLVFLLPASRAHPDVYPLLFFSFLEGGRMLDRTPRSDIKWIRKATSRVSSPLLWNLLWRARIFSNLLVWNEIRIVKNRVDVRDRISFYTYIYYKIRIRSTDRYIWRNVVGFSLTDIKYIEKTIRPIGRQHPDVDVRIFAIPQILAGGNGCSHKRSHGAFLRIGWRNASYALTGPKLKTTG